jgi:hypothetical protein
MKLSMSHVSAALVSAALLGTPLCTPLGAQRSVLPAIDSARLVTALSVLSADSMEGRRIGTPGGARARTYLKRSVDYAGLTPIGGSLEQPFTARGRGGEVQGVNLIGVVRGTAFPDRYIVVSAHYDHLGVRGPGVKGDSLYNGADDNASGSASILSLASWFAAHPPENSLLFVWFDGEEQGETGSKYFVDHPPVPLVSIIADVNLDMVSRNAKGELYAARATPWPVMRPLLDSLVEIAAVTLKLGHDSGIGQENWIHQSDQGAFADKKIPFVYFGVEDHPDYHKPSDSFDHIQPGFYFRATMTIAEFVRRLDLGLGRVAAIR